MNILSSSGLEPNAAAQKTGLLTVLDIGSSKIACLIVRLSPLGKALQLPWRTHRIEVLGFAVRQSQGIRCGLVTDIAAAEQVVRRTVGAAERAAGLTVKSVIVNFSGRYMRSECVRGDISLKKERVQLADVRAVIQSACEKRTGSDDKWPLIHAVPLRFNVDDYGDLEDPRDMAGAKLGAELHCLGVQPQAARNLERCLNRAYLQVEALVASPYASGLSTLLREEVQFGATCVDFGGGTTGFAIFRKGRLVHADCIAVGGRHITADIAQAFSIGAEEAEWLKIMHGSAAADECGEEKNIRLESGRRISRRALADIIRPRAEEISELMRDRCARAGFPPAGRRRLVLTGGAAQLNGLTDTVEAVMGVKPRIGRPLGISGLPPEARGGAYAAVTGLSVYPQSLGFSEQEFTPGGTEYEPGGRLKSAGARLLKSVNGYVRVFKGF